MLKMGQADQMRSKIYKNSDKEVGKNKKRGKRNESMCLQFLNKNSSLKDNVLYICYLYATILMAL